MTKTRPIHSIMTAVIQEQDLEPAMDALRAEDIPVRHFSSTGGFLGRRNATLIIALTDGMAEKIITALRGVCRQRVEYLTLPLEGSPLPMPTPVPVTVGGATIFTFPVERFEEI